MKKSPKAKRLRAVCRVLSAVLLMSSLLTVSSPLSVRAEMSEDEYEAKKAAYRKKLMEDDVTTDDLLIGSWVSFYSFDIDSYEYQLDQMAAAGINFNMFPRDFGAGAMFDAEYWNNIEEQYAKRNMLYHMNGSWGDTLEIGVQYAAGKEHCIGYHVVDEPSGAQLEAVTDIIKAYRAADQERYPFVNLVPSFAGAAYLGGTYYEHVSRFVELAGPENIEYLSHDHYPFLADGSVKTSIFADFEVIRKVAYENGKLKTHAFPQSTEWTGARMPNIDEMRWNVYGYLAYGFKALSWFNLVCPGSSDTAGEGFKNSLIYRDGTIRDPELFAAWSELNWEVRGLSSILMNLDTVHAYHTGPRISGVEVCPANFVVKCLSSSSEGFIFSEMEPKEGDDSYIMIFNKDWDESLSARFRVNESSGVKWLEYFDPFIGEHIPVELEDGEFKTDFRPGEGKLFRLRYDDPPAETEAPTETVTETATQPKENDVTTAAGTASKEKGCAGALNVGTLGLTLALLPTVFLRRRRKKACR